MSRSQHGPSAARSRSITLIVGASVVFLLSAGVLRATEPQLGTQWGPFLDWRLENRSFQGDPFDLVATVTFTHTASGTRHTTETFYAGGRTWKFRFTGPRTGTWTYRVSSSIADWNGQTGTITIAPNPEPRAHGYITSFDGDKWGWQGTESVFVPQLAMYKTPNRFHDRPDTIEADIQQFMVEHGFNGFHVPSIAGRWFNVDADDDRVDAGMTHPDPRTFDALELLITKVHAAGGMVHLWAWGDHSRHQTPHDLRGGINGPIDRRLQRTIAARLGPLPGWTLGYGFDLWEWVDGPQLTAWHAYLHNHFGWHHFLGARATKNTLDQLSEALDYSGYEQHRPDYDTYVATLAARPDKPSFSEDRFRLRDEGRAKDYTAEETRRGLWQSTMAGGVANIWGNLLADGDTRNGELGSAPYPNRAQFKTYSIFFNDHKRFQRGLQPAPHLSADADTRVLARGHTQIIYYRENATSISVDLSELRGAQIAIAVDTKTAYEEIRAGTISPGKHLWQAPYRSDWALAIGSWPSQEGLRSKLAPPTPTGGMAACAR